MSIHQNFMPLSFISIHFLLFIISGNAPVNGLRCYQGVQSFNSSLDLASSNLSVPIVDCPMPNALTCTKTVDFRTQIVTRACQASNCTINQASTLSISTQPVCVNNSNTQTTFCCCYGDACNSAPQKSPMNMGAIGFLLILMIPMVISKKDIFCGKFY